MTQIGDRLVTVFLKLKTGTYKGAGTWGCAKTVEEARKIARKELRSIFGAAAREAEEIIEWQVFTEEGWKLEIGLEKDPIAQAGGWW